MAHMLTKTQKTRVVKTVQKHDEDTGSASVQIGLLTKKISELAAHLKKHTKDKHSRRGLLQMVANRRTHMKYLEKSDKKEYNKVVRTLGLKK
jgi:small subunit ribosomal protein S15